MTTVLTFFYLCFCPFYVHESVYNVNTEILLCQIIGPALCRTCSYARDDKAVSGQQPLTRSSVDYRPSIYVVIVKKLNSLKHFVRTTVAESHN